MKTLPPPQFVISSIEAESMTKSLNLPSTTHLLPHLLSSAQSLARPPISNFHVATLGLSSDGRIFLGVNIEFPNLPLHHSIHAEQFLLTNLSINNSPNLTHLAVSAAPCGHCRQFLQELRHSSKLQILIITDHFNSNDDNNNTDLGYDTLSKLLPNPFGPHDLLDNEHPLLLEKHDNKLEFLNLDIGELEREGLEAANNAHCPYSGCPSGVALRDSDGKVYKGSYVESAAYNPSLGPLQAAFVAYVAGGGEGYDKIVEAVLVEKDGALVKQEETVRMLLKAVSPKCVLKVCLCQKAENGCVLKSGS